MLVIPSALRWALLAIFWILTGHAGAIELDINFTLIRDPSLTHETQPRLQVIRIGLKEGNGTEINHFIRTDSAAILDPRRFQLKQNGKPVPFSPLLKNPKGVFVSAIY